MRDYPCLFVCLMVFIVISWGSVLLVEETGGPGKNNDLCQVTDNLYHIMLYTSPWSRIELTTSVVIGTDCIGSCKSKYHMITAPRSSTSTQIKVKEQRFYCGFTFHSHCRVFNNEHNSYHKMSLIIHVNGNIFQPHTIFLFIILLFFTLSSFSSPSLLHLFCLSFLCFSFLCNINIRRIYGLFTFVNTPWRFWFFICK